MMRVSPHSHSGVTLSEILISMLVMSIGVVSLATLFPISILRSIQATQLTNATIHRLNTEQVIALSQKLALNPDGDLPTANPNFLTEHEVEGQANDDPQYVTDNPMGDGVTKARYIVDPLGATAPTLSGVASFFGNDGGGPPPVRINRYGSFFTGLTSLSKSPNCFLPDTWQVYSKGTVASVINNQTIAVPNNIDLAELSQTISSPNVLTRIVLYSSNGKQSIVRSGLTATPGSPGTIAWADAIPQTAPFYIDTDNDGTVDTLSLSRFRVETYEPRYSWLLTVRRFTTPRTAGTNDAEVEVVIFHKRAFKQSDEQIFTTNLNQFSTSCTLTIPPAAAKPFLKKGGFLFDAQNAYWYRIVQIENETTNNPKITIDKPASATTTQVLALPGVVEVYRIPDIRYYDTVNSPKASLAE